MFEAPVLEQRLGYRFRDSALLERAMTHRSWVAESDSKVSNERLEFLGDAVLGWVVADLVFQRFPDAGEGTLTDLRKSVVNAKALSEVANDVGLGEFVLLGHGEQVAGGRHKVSILSDAVEAVIGAAYLDGGAASAFALVERLFSARIDAAVEHLDRLDYKTSLQEIAARRGWEPPVYSTSARGPDHQRHFTATVAIGGQQFTGEGRAKKVAEQQAAAHAVTSLNALVTPSQVNTPD